MFSKPALTHYPIHDLLVSRWSGRAYDPHRPVARADLLSLLEAARWAPSCYGDQPWRFLVWDKYADPQSWQQALECLATGNQSWAQYAPILMLSLADSQFMHNAEANRWGQYDTGAAAMSLCIQATALGIMVHQMGGFDAEKAAARFGIPSRYVPMAMISLGYQLAQADIPEDMKAREFAERSRAAMQERFFEAQWGVGMAQR
jgi:nitroreductase